MQEIQFYLVDAFSDKNFGGNAAGCLPAQRVVSRRCAPENGPAA